MGKLLDALASELGAPAGGVALTAGVFVQIHGLQGAKELNGRSGRLQMLDVASGRWQVEVEGAGLKRLKPENLRALQDDFLGDGAAKGSGFLGSQAPEPEGTTYL